MKLDWIITNPPYSKTTEFMRKALELQPTKGFCWFWTLLVKGPIADKRIDMARVQGYLLTKTVMINVLALSTSRLEKAIYKDALA